MCKGPFTTFGKFEVARAMQNYVSVKPCTWFKLGSLYGYTSIDALLLFYCVLTKTGQQRPMTKWMYKMIKMLHIFDAREKQTDYFKVTLSHLNVKLYKNARCEHFYNLDYQSKLP